MKPAPELTPPLAVSRAEDPAARYRFGSSVWAAPHFVLRSLCSWMAKMSKSSSDECNTGVREFQEVMFDDITRSAGKSGGCDLGPSPGYPFVESNPRWGLGPGGGPHATVGHAGGETKWLPTILGGRRRSTRWEQDASEAGSWGGVCHGLLEYKGGMLLSDCTAAVSAGGPWKVVCCNSKERATGPRQAAASGAGVYCILAGTGPRAAKSSWPIVLLMHVGSKWLLCLFV
jgi:hypothetical protein